MSEETAIKVADEKALAILDAEGDSGFEGTEANDFSIPFLTLLQKGSDQCDEDKPEYIKEAKPGQWYDPAANELLDEVEVIPCVYKKAMVEWKPDRGGFVAQHEPGVEEGLSRNDKGAYVNKEGNLLIDTRYYFCLKKGKDGGWSPVIVAMSSSHIKTSRLWMTRMRAIKFKRADNSEFNPAMYTHSYNLSSATQSNDKYTWKVPQVEKIGPITDEKLFATVKETREMFKKAQDAVKPPSNSTTDEESVTL